MVGGNLKCQRPGGLAMADRHDVVEGGCLCGAIRYKSSKAPIQGAYCHCAICQKIYGGLFMAAVQFNCADFQFAKGVPKYYRSSKYARRGFCADCGTPLIMAYDETPSVWALIGSLDRPQDWPLTNDAVWSRAMHLHVDRKVAWSVIDDGLPQFTSETTPFRDEATERASSGPASET